MRRLIGVFVFVASGVAPVACAEVSGLNDFSTGTGDASAPLKTTTPEASPPDEPDVAADDESDANELSSDGDDGPTADDADLEADAPGASDTGDDADAGPTEPPEAGGSDAAPSDGGNPSPDASDGACPQYVHQNGMGQTYTDCTPPMTYDAAEATKACTAANAGACATNAICIGGGAVCTTTTLPCECWAYAGSTAGHANKSLAGPVCGCPGAGDPMWQ